LLLCFNGTGDVEELLLQVTKWSIQGVHPLHTICKESINCRLT